MEDEPDFARQVRRLAQENPSVEGERPIMPELTGDLFIDAIQQTGIGYMEIERLARAERTRIEVVCDDLLKIAGSLGGGLDPAGKQLWIAGRLEEGFDLDELISQAEKLKAS